jgi:hypothetical protein
MNDDLLKPVELPEPFGEMAYRQFSGAYGRLAGYTTNQLTARDAIYLSRIAKLIEERDAAKSEIAEAKPVADTPAIGDYVLATKWSDGDPGDAWALGFYAGAAGDRHMVKDGNGEQCRMNGYRRVGKVTTEFGAWLWKHRAVLEESPPGTVNLWGMLGVRAAAAIGAAS